MQCLNALASRLVKLHFPTPALQLTLPLVPGHGGGGQTPPVSSPAPGGGSSPQTSGGSNGSGGSGSLIPTFAVSLLRTPPRVAPLPAACKADQSCSKEVCGSRMACGPDAHCEPLRCGSGCFEACILNLADAPPTACPTSEVVEGVALGGKEGTWPPLETK